MKINLRTTLLALILLGSLASWIFIGVSYQPLHAAANNDPYEDIEFIDPNPDLLKDGKLTDDLDDLAEGGRPIVGAVADGVTLVLLRRTVPATGTVEFCVAGGEVDEDGGVRKLGAVDVVDCVVADTNEINGKHIAFAVYKVPLNFNRPGVDEAEAQRTIEFETVFTPEAGGAPIAKQRDFTLTRPPILLMHGLWSSPATWANFEPLVSDPRFRVTTVNYSRTHASSFADNQMTPYRYVLAALRAIRADGFAATQVDIVGHSMGGNLSRYYTQHRLYNRGNNYNQGDFHKIITVNTPHTGSALANVVVTLRERPLIGAIVKKAFRVKEKPIDKGAIDDLAEGSVALDAIARTKVPSHALVGTGGSDILAGAPGGIGLFYKMVNFFAPNIEFFQNLQHDFVVDRNSQEGGITTYTLFGGAGSVHDAVTSNAMYSNRVIELLNQAADGGSFAEFPAHTAVAGRAMLELDLPTSNHSRQVSSESVSELVISSSTSSISPGEVIEVMLQPPSDVVIQRVLFVAPGIAEVDEEAPFEVQLTIPEDVGYDFIITAIGADSMDSDAMFYASNDLSFDVTFNATLESVEIMEPLVVLPEAGDSQYLTVLGTYSDGITREMHMSDVSFSVSDSDVIDITDDGVITAYRAGEAVVTVVDQATQTLLDTVPVSVLFGDEYTTLHLSAGSNLVSLPLVPSSDDVEVIFADILGQVTGVYAYDGCDVSDPWKTYHPQATLSNDLEELDEQMGVWVFASEPISLTVAGSVPVTPTVPLCDGWNFVGYPSLAVVYVEDGMAALTAQNYTAVTTYRWQSWLSFEPAATSNTLYYLYPGDGLWVSVDE